MYRLATIFCVLALALWGCESSPTNAPEVQPTPSVDSLEWLAEDGSVLPFAPVQGLVEGPLTVRVRTLDSGGHPVPGVQIRFIVQRGMDSVSAPGATTDSAGIARTNVTIGEGITWVFAEAQEKRSGLMLLARARYSVNFTVDSVTLLGPGCGTELFAPVSAAGGSSTLGHSVKFTATVPGILNFTPLTVGSGSTRGMRTHISGLQAGETLVIGTEYYGAADTIPVRVLPSVPTSLELRNTRFLLATGDTARLEARMYNQCRADVPGATALFRSLNPRVATVDASGKITTHAAGSALIEAAWNSFTDTATVEVRTLRILPADTTVMVGDTVHYRVFQADTTGVFSPTRTAGFISDARDVAVGPESMTRGNQGAVVAVGEGSATITAITDVGRTIATLRVNRRQ